MCRAGSYSEDGVEPTCRKCDYGWYQDQQGSNNCTQCPNGTTTFERGSVNSSFCKGTVFNTSFYGIINSPGLPYRTKIFSTKVMRYFKRC